MLASLITASLLTNGLAAFQDAPPPAATTQPASRPAWREATPLPDLSPADVVTIVLDALADNGDDDAGIRVTFEFASPGNREATGPIERFIPLVKQQPYDVLIDSADRELGPFREVDGVAEQAVRVVADDGRVQVFVFRLSKQVGGEYDGCWMTDGVVPVELAPPPEQRGRQVL